MKKYLSSFYAFVFILITFGMANQLYAASYNASWPFLLGNYSDNYDSAGIPLSGIESRVSEYDSAFWQRLSAALPSGQDLRQTNPQFIVNNDVANLLLQEDCELYVTFLHDGGRYRSNLAYYTYQNGNEPSNVSDLSPTIFFPNSSYFDDGGSSKGLRAGDTISLGSFTAGDRVGLALVADGFDKRRGTKRDQDLDDIFYTYSALNRESDSGLKSHTAMLYDQVTNKIIISMEDIFRSGSDSDHDFNDIVVCLVASPSSAIDPSVIPVISNSNDDDNDGVKNCNDDFPQDPERAFITYYPNKCRSGSLAFEDKWPRKGDYDLNDMVVKYKYKIVLNAQHKIKDINATYRLKARGAGYHNGFGILFPGTLPGNLEESTLKINSGTEVSLSAEGGQSNLVFTLFNTAQSYTPAPSGYEFFNTELGSPVQSIPVFYHNVTFTQAVDLSDIGNPPYNPFIFRKESRGLEVHLPGYLPTDKADSILFQTEDDDTTPSEGKYYQSGVNHPWAIDLPINWQYPLERVEISNGYPTFLDWAESGGTSHQDWYLNKNTEYLY